MIHLLGGSAGGARLHHASETGTQSYGLLISGKLWIVYFWKFPFNIFGPWLTTGNWDCGKRNHR